jgi:glycerol-3-phosphate dehydrogenase (NAD(P)+)
MGAQRETFAGLAGLGDLVTTCISPYGRNRSFGEAIGSGRTAEQAKAVIPGEVEGAVTAEGVLALAARHDVEMPITAAVESILDGTVTPSEAIVRLMSRPSKAEGQ